LYLTLNATNKEDVIEMFKNSMNNAQNTQELLKILEYKKKKCDLIYLIIKRKKIIEDITNIEKIFNLNKFKFVQLIVEIARVKFETRIIKQESLNISNNSNIVRSLTQRVAIIRFAQIKRKKISILTNRIISRLLASIVQLQ